MLTVDISAALAKTIGTTAGLTDQDWLSLKTLMKKHVTSWLEERKAGKHTWSLDPYNKRLAERVKETAKRAKQMKIQTIVWVGIGGSSLGPRVIQEAFESTRTVEFIIIDTIDPAALQFYLEILDWKSTMVVVVSKSGETLESMSAFFLFWDRLKSTRGIKPAHHVVGITDAKRGELRSFCMDHDIEMLPITRDTGGRYCIFTPAGLLALALLDQEIDDFLRGAKDMDTICQNVSLDENPAAQLAAGQFLLETKRGYQVRIIMPYSQRLASIARWNQQLIAESLGKDELHNPIPLAAVGTQDQHSLLQQWMQGPRKGWHLFIRETEKPELRVPKDLDPEFKYMAGKTFGQLLDACYEGTSRALTSVKRPHATLTLSRLDAYHLGQLFFVLMTEVVLLGKLYRIDPYGQPGVELGKTIAKQILSQGAGEPD
jgi:glucose-6-phosphate isomerase